MSKLPLSARFKSHCEQWNGCTKCPLHENAHKKALHRGRLPADILFIGEGPGKFEDYEGEPFVGPAGILLDQIIRDAHNHVLDTRPDLLDIRIGFTNVLACMPIDGPLSEPREPSKAEALACRPRLTELMAMSRPKGIVLVGKSANKFVPVDATKRLFIVHPAHILRIKEPTKQALAIKTCILKVSQFMSLTVPKV